MSKANRIKSARLAVGTPRNKKGSNPRRGGAGYQKNLSVADALHMAETQLHELHHDLNEGRDNDPKWWVSSPALTAKLKEYKELVEELRFYPPDLPRISNYIGEKSLLRTADKKEMIAHLRDLLRTRIFFWGKNVKRGKTYYERRFLRTGPKSSRLPSCAQGIRISHSPVLNLFNREQVELARAEGDEAAVRFQQQMQADEEAFFPKARAIVIEWTGEDNQPLMAAEIVAADKHRDTGLAHDDYVLSEVGEMDPENAVEVGIPIHKPIGKKKLEKYGIERCAELVGRAFIRIGKPQMGRQGPAMVGWHLQKLAGYKLPKEQAEQYASKVARGRDERGYGDDGLGIDVAWNEAFYRHCKEKAISKGLGAAWAKAEADYVEWLERAAVVKMEIARLRELAVLSFDGDKEKQAARDRRRDVETVRRIIRSSLPFDDAAMRELARAHPLRKISELILDGVATIPELIRQAGHGLGKFIDYLAGLFKSGMPARLPLARAEIDPDFEASVQQEVDKRSAMLEPVRISVPVEVERIIEVPVPVPGPVRFIKPVESEAARMWREWAEILKHDLSIDVPLVRKVVGEHLVGIKTDFRDAFWKGKKAEYERQKAVMVAEAARVKAVRAQVDAELDEKEAAANAARIAAANEKARPAATPTVVGPDVFEDADRERKQVAEITAAKAMVLNLRDKFGHVRSKPFSGPVLFAASRLILADPDPVKREARVLRLMKALLSSQNDPKAAAPADLAAVVSFDQVKPYELDFAPVNVTPPL